MPKNLMPVVDICGNPLSEAQGHGSMLVAQEIRVSQCELEARLVGRHGKDRLSSICDPELLEELRRRAREQGRSERELLEEAVKSYV